MLNTTDRVQGWADAPLTKDGVAVAEYLGKGLNGVKFEKHIVAIVDVLLKQRKLY